MDCPQQEKNSKNCTYTSCSRYGNYCAFIAYHRERNELPGCLFPPEVEKTYDRSVKKYIESQS
jgi:hypothetical protein